MLPDSLGDWTRFGSSKHNSYYVGEQQGYFNLCCAMIYQAILDMQPVDRLKSVLGACDLEWLPELLEAAYYGDMMTTQRYTNLIGKVECRA